MSADNILDRAECTCRRDAFARAIAGKVAADLPVPAEWLAEFRDMDSRIHHGDEHARGVAS